MQTQIQMKYIVTLIFHFYNRLRIPLKICIQKNIRLLGKKKKVINMIYLKGQIIANHINTLTETET